MEEGPQGWLHLSRALSRYGFSSCPNSCVLSRSDRWVAGNGSGQAAVGSQSEGEMCWHQTPLLGQVVPLGHSMQDFLCLRGYWSLWHLFPPPGRCSVRLSDQQMLFPFCSHLPLRTTDYFPFQYLSNLFRLMHWSHRIKIYDKSTSGFKLFKWKFNFLSLVIPFVHWLI